MLREIGPVRQVPGEPRRRWFSSANCDLVVWVAADESPVGFSFSYDKQHREHALVWNAQGQFEHTGIDSGETHPLRYKASPLHVADGIFDGDRVAEIFHRESVHVPGDIAGFVARKITESASAKSGDGA
jgi:hypothetical protein